MLTKKQYQLKKFIHDFLQFEGRKPTLREIGKGLGLSAVSSVHELVKRTARNEGVCLYCGEPYYDDQRKKL